MHDCSRICQVCQISAKQSSLAGYCRDPVKMSSGPPSYRLGVICAAICHLRRGIAGVGRFLMVPLASFNPIGAPGSHLAEVRPSRPWHGPLRHDRFPGCGQVQDRPPRRSRNRARVPPGTDTAAEPVRPTVVEESAAVADPDLPKARPLPGQVRAERNAEARAGRTGVRIALDHRPTGCDQRIDRLVADGARWAARL